MTVLLAASVAAIAACEGQGASPSAGSSAVQDSDLVTAQDFADESEKQITTSNYKSELDTLEREIQSEQ
jgi:hypothetical protein